MLRFKDFAPRRKTKGGFFSAEDYESFEKAAEAAGAWLRDSAIRPLNVETVLLPNVWDEGEEGTADGSLDTGNAATWHQIVRVWYEAK